MGYDFYLPVIQSRYLDKFSFIECADKLSTMLGDYPQVAIGTVCKCKDMDFILYCCQVARKFFPNSWIHAFGLTLNALPKVKRYINSFDSMAWTFPRTHGSHSCKNKHERKQYFETYLKKVLNVAPEVRFYTFPDVAEYPYILCNRKNYEILFSPKHNFKHAIVDVGVVEFKNPHVKDYPPNFIKYWKQKTIQLNEVFKGKVWFVIPDYPDDYNPGQFGDNISKTLENIKYFLNL